MKESKHLERRRIEAEMIARIYREMTNVVDSETALQVLTTVIENAAFEEGQAFEAKAKGDPSLDHFGKILGYWGDAMDIEDIEEDGGTLRFRVVRCHYIKFYEKAGLPPELVKLLSCARDAPFAKGYGIEFSRNRTLAEGADHCDFCYNWRSSDE